MTPLLILIPTDFELQKLQPLLTDSVKRAGGVIATCGFGPIVAGIRTTQLLAFYKPHAAILIGIAGALGPQLPIGTAAFFSRIACYGIGAGSGLSFETASELGWPLWTDPECGQLFGDVIEPTVESDPGESAGSMLLTVCAASGCTEVVAQRLRKFPLAVAEDMEAFSVALACRIARIPLTVIRGISNMAGDRDKTNWNIAAALKAAAELAALRIST
ncbi:MAG: futalosine hydrolase [Planctomycetota bacterium]